MNQAWSCFEVEGYTDVHDTNLDIRMARKHVDSGAPAQKIQDHLRSHCGGIGAHPFYRHPMIGGEGKDCPPWDFWLHVTCNHDVPRGQFFESSQAADGLGQSIKADLRLCQKPRICRLNSINRFTNQHTRHSSYFKRSERPLIAR